MAKKARKTRWRKLPIPIGTRGGSGGSHQDEEESGSGGGGGRTHQHRHHHHHTSHSHSSGAAHASSPNQETNPLNSTASYNEDEYTKITTPRQDMLFKKGYLTKKKSQTAQPPVDTADSQSAADSMESEQYLCEEPQYIYAAAPTGYIDPNGLFFINNGGYGGYEGYVAPFPAVPLHTVDWFTLPPIPAPWHQHPHSTQLQNGSCESPLSPVSGQREDSPDSASGESQTGSGGVPPPHQLIYQPQYVYPGYMFGTPLYSMNGVSVAPGVTSQPQGVPCPQPTAVPHPPQQQQQQAAAHMQSQCPQSQSQPQLQPQAQPSVDTCTAPPVLNGTVTLPGKQRRKKRRRRRRGGVTDEGSESSCEEQNSTCESGVGGAEESSQSGASSDTAPPTASSTASSKTGSDSGVQTDPASHNSGADSPGPQHVDNPPTPPPTPILEQPPATPLTVSILTTLDDAQPPVDIEVEPGDGPPPPDIQPQHHQPAQQEHEQHHVDKEEPIHCLEESKAETEPETVEDNRLEEYAAALASAITEEAAKKAADKRVLPITEAVARWLRDAAAPPTWQWPHTDPHQEESDDEEPEEEPEEEKESTGQKNVRGNPYPAPSRSGAGLRVAFEEDEEERTRREGSAGSSAWSAVHWEEDNTTTPDEAAGIGSSRVSRLDKPPPPLRIAGLLQVAAPLPAAAVCCIIQ